MHKETLFRKTEKERKKGKKDRQKGKERKKKEKEEKKRKEMKGEEEKKKKMRKPNLDTLSSIILLYNYNYLCRQSTPLESPRLISVLNRSRAQILMG